MQQALKTSEGFSATHVELLKNTVAKGASDDQLKLFLMIAQRSGLDPFSRQIHFVKRGVSGVIQTGIDGYRAIAARTGQHAGTDDAIFAEDPETKLPKSATVAVYRMISNQRCAFTATARWEEYKQEYNGRLIGLWEKMPYQMLAKCAEALALRKAFPSELSGLYTHEEMSQADNNEVRVTTDEQKTEVPITPTALGLNKLEEAKKDDAPEAKPAPTSFRTAAEVLELEKREKEQKQLIVSLLTALGEHPKTARDYRSLVRLYTKLELLPENYAEIVERLNVLGAERAPKDEEGNDAPTE